MSDTQNNNATIIDCNSADVIVYINLKDMCVNESQDCYERIQQFVANQKTEILLTDIQNVMKNVPDLVHITKESEESEESKESKESKQAMLCFENLLILNMFIRLKWLETCCYTTRTETNRYYKDQQLYITNNSIISANIHLYNVMTETEKIEIPCYKLLEQVLTPYKISQELLTYELLNYRPDNKIMFNEMNLKSVADQIRSELNRFSPIVHSYLEDRVWTINYNDTMNFSVGKNKIVFSNTISTHNQENNILVAHINTMTKFIKKCFKIKTLKYAIIEDNKYYFTWILIFVGYYCK